MRRSRSWESAIDHDEGLDDLVRHTQGTECGDADEAGEDDFEQNEVFFHAVQSTVRART